MSSNQVAFFIGLFGSVHCIGMCGPLAFAIPSFDTRWWRIVIDKVTYNAGRVITYSLLGLLIGLLGRQLWLAGLQQGVSVVTGLLIIGAALSRLVKIRFSKSRLMPKILAPVNRLISY